MGLTVKSLLSRSNTDNRYGPGFTKTEAGDVLLYRKGVKKDISEVKKIKLKGL